METQKEQGTFYVIMDLSEPDEERIELFTREDAVAIYTQEKHDNPSHNLEVREF